MCFQATTDLYGNCTLRHSGTSAAAPEAAGVFALALEAKYVHGISFTYMADDSKQDRLFSYAEKFKGTFARSDIPNCVTCPKPFTKMIIYFMLCSG